MRRDKKADETAIVSRFLAGVGVVSDCVIEQESPDFVVRLPDGSLIGIEVVTPVIAFDVFSEADRTVTAWKSVLSEKGIHGVLVEPRFNGSALLEGQSRKHRRREADAVAEIARTMTDDTLVLSSTELRSMGLVRLERLEMRCRDDESLLILPGLNIASPLSDLRIVLAGKRARVARWRDEQPELDAFWLLWAIWPGSFAGPEFPSDQELANGGFDRTYEVNASNGKARLIASS